MHDFKLLERHCVWRLHSRVTKFSTVHSLDETLDTRQSPLVLLSPLSDCPLYPISDSLWLDFIIDCFSSRLYVSASCMYTRSNAECSGLPLIICTDNPGRILAVVSRQRT